jgi:two-component system, chemotaxis family, chemotaxis protein CheY
MRPTASFRVLVVDDYREMITIIRRMLLQFGFKEIDDASDGPSALVKLRSGPYDLVIADLMMEPMDGIELLRVIRSEESLQSLPFIMVTALSEEHHIVSARDAGVTAYIVKPFTAAILKKRIDAVLQAT